MIARLLELLFSTSPEVMGKNAALKLMLRKAQQERPNVEQSLKQILEAQ